MSIDTASLLFVKGKNLIDESKLVNGSVAAGTGKYGYFDYSVVSDFIAIGAGSYKFKLFNAEDIALFRVVGYDINKNCIWSDDNLSDTERVITTNTTKYLRLCFRKGGFLALTPADVIAAKPQLEAGTATSYETYVKKRIVTKNDKESLEEFLNEIEEKEYYRNEELIGTWIDGKALYRKIIVSTTYSSSYSIGITNIAEIVNVKAMVHRKDYPNLYNPIPSRLGNSQYFIDFGNFDKSNNGSIGVLWGSGHSANTVDSVVFIVEYTKNS